MKFDEWYSGVVGEENPVTLTILLTSGKIVANVMTRENALKTLHDCIRCFEVREVFIVSGDAIATLVLCNWRDEVSVYLSANIGWDADGGCYFGKDADGDHVCIIDRRG